MRGRKPVPTSLVELRGRPSHDRKPNPREPKPHGDLAEAPEALSDDQRDAWNYIIAAAPPSMLKRLDRGALLVYVIAQDLHAQAFRAQNKGGLVAKTKTGALIQSPFLPIINRQGLIMLRAAAELGFTPVSRPRIGAPQFLPPMPPQPGANDATTSRAPRRSLDLYLDDNPSALN